MSLAYLNPVERTDFSLLNNKENKQRYSAQKVVNFIVKGWTKTAGKRNYILITLEILKSLDIVFEKRNIFC